MTFKEIHDKITMGQYNYPHFEVIPKLSSSYVVDENQTVVWNREKVKELNKEREAKIKEYKDKCNAIDETFNTDCITAITEDINVSDIVARRILRFAIDICGCTAAHEIINYVQDVCLFVEDILKYMKVSEE